MGLAKVAKSRTSGAAAPKVTDASVSTNVAAGGETRDTADAARSERPADPNVPKVAAQHQQDPKLHRSLDKRVADVSNPGDKVVQFGEGLHGERSTAVRDLQREMLACDADLVNDAVRAEYGNRTTGRDGIPIATDGRYGKATDLAVRRLRAKFGMDAEGGVTAEFIEQLRSRAAAPAIGGEHTDKTPAEIPVMSGITADETKKVADDVKRCLNKGASKGGDTLENVLAGVREVYGAAGLSSVVLELGGERGKPENIERALEKTLRKIAESKKLSPVEMADAFGAIFPSRYSHDDLVAAANLHVELRHRNSWSDKVMNPLMEACQREDGALTGAGTAFVEVFGWSWLQIAGRDNIEKDPQKFFDRVTGGRKDYWRTPH